MLLPNDHRLWRNILEVRAQCQPSSKPGTPLVDQSRIDKERPEDVVGDFKHRCISFRQSEYLELQSASHAIIALQHAPFFPKSHGKPRVDDRCVLNGIIFINRNGLRWRAAPKEYGPDKTLYNRLKR